MAAFFIEPASAFYPHICKIKVVKEERSVCNVIIPTFDVRRLLKKTHERIELSYRVKTKF